MAIYKNAQIGGAALITGFRWNNTLETLVLPSMSYLKNIFSKDLAHSLLIP